MTNCPPSTKYACDSQELTGTTVNSHASVLLRQKCQVVSSLPGPILPAQPSLPFFKSSYRPLLLCQGGETEKLTGGGGGAEGQGTKEGGGKKRKGFANWFKKESQKFAIARDASSNKQLWNTIPRAWRACYLPSRSSFILLLKVLLFLPRIRVVLLFLLSCL